MARKKGRSKTKKKGKQESRLGALLAGFLLGEPVDGPLRERLQEIKGLVFIGFSLWLLISLFTYWTPPGDKGALGHNWGGDAGFYLANAALIACGLSGYLLAALVGLWGFVIVGRRKVSWPAVRFLGGLCLIAALSLMLQLAFGVPPAASDPAMQRDTLDHLRTEGLLDNRLPYGPGGWLAVEVTPRLVERFGGPGLWVLLATMLFVSFLLATEMAFFPALRALSGWLSERRERWGETVGPALWGWFKGLVHGLWDFVRGADLEPQAAAAGAPGGTGRARARGPGREREGDDEDDEDEDEEDEEDENDEDGEDEDWDEDEELEDDEATLVPPRRERNPLLTQTRIEAPTYERVTPPPGPWKLPPLDLLEPPITDFEQDREFLVRSARALEGALQSFRVEAEVVGAQVGPAVTLFELTVAQGTRMNRVTQLSQEIAATLRARSVRIIAPIPGKATIGVEVPNNKRRTVRISELVTQKAYDPKIMALPLFLGVDAEGHTIVEDLARMPHLLIAGTTGSGKSVCINTILASLLLTRSPHDVRLILVDPKMVELQMFSDVPHLELPVVTDMRQATNVLLWAVDKMEARYDLFRSASVKNIKSYNGLGEDELRKRMGADFNEDRTPRHVPYIVVVIDEMADLMMQSKKEAEQAITRLAQKSRAVGIHVIVATQRPSIDVLTGVIKGNLPCRIAFQVASKVDSRVILDAMGAEKLLGSGDMLYTPPQSSQLRRVQGALVEDHELGRLVEFVCKDSAQSFNQELVQTATGARSGTTDPYQAALDADDRFEDAVEVILKTRRGSASLLQRALGIGYTRASRLIDLMTDAGIVGDHKGSKAREILVTLEDWEAARAARAGEGSNDG